MQKYKRLGSFNAKPSNLTSNEATHLYRFIVIPTLSSHLLEIKETNVLY